MSGFDPAAMLMRGINRWQVHVFYGAGDPVPGFLIADADLRFVATVTDAWAVIPILRAAGVKDCFYNRERASIEQLEAVLPKPPYDNRGRYVPPAPPECSSSRSA